MQIDASRTLRRGAFHKPIFNPENTMVNVHAFSKAEVQNDDRDDSLYGMAIRATRAPTYSSLRRQEIAYQQ